MDRNSTHPGYDLLYLLIGLAVWAPLVVRSIMWPPPAVVRDDVRIVQPIVTPMTQPVTPTVAASQPVVAGNSDNGKTIYASTCTACHGPNAEGVPGLGKDLTTSEFITGLSDDELLDFIKRGRDMSDPLNTTGIAMPPKGGNPALTDEQTVDIIAYLRSIQK
jgi:disulfide bond formation protein DsbB